VATSEASRTELQSGLVVAWELGAAVQSFVAKSGKTWTVVELRNPQELRQYVTVWLEGEAGPGLQSVPPRTVIGLRVDGLRAGRERGELVATASRATVEEAFARAGGRA
jgi:hypothetical protein